MLVRETARSAWRSLASNRMRTALTALGMVIGVAAVVAVLAVGEGASASVTDRIRSLGSNLLTVRPGDARSGGVRTSGRVETLKRSDATALAAIAGIRAVAPEASTNVQVRYLTVNLNASVVGVTSSYFEVRALDIAQGLGVSDLDDTQRARVVILGANVAQQLFPEGRRLGARIQLRGIAFRVVGVLAEKGTTGGTSADDQLFVPLGTLQGVLTGKDNLSALSLSLEDEGQTAGIQGQIEQLLRLRHRLRSDQDNDFDVRSQAQMLETMSAVTGTFTMLLGSVAAVSLLVGGIGIMNIMLVSVRERTREIGVRMAVGARRRDVLLQFLVEAVVVSVAGGLLGIGLGYLAASLIAKLGGWATVVPVYSVALALTVSVLIGIVFGVGPARRASRLDPVEALRQE
ncbi:MAG: ABC transporter permease [Polyangiaceae bacterium]|nr:ABC transporter permease [Polyangiaceae bacterium]